MVSYRLRIKLVKGRCASSAEKLAAEKSALRKALTNVETVKDNAADELEKKDAERVRLQEEVAALREYSNAQRHIRKVFEDKCTGPDPDESVQDNPLQFKKEEDPMNGARDEQVGQPA